MDLGPENRYWTWRLACHVGGQFASKIDAKWDAALNGYLVLKRGLAALKEPHNKAVDHYSKVKANGTIEGVGDGVL